MNSVLKCWPDPKPIKSSLAEVEELKLKIIPESLQAYIRDICYRMQCPLDVVAATSIVMTSSIIGAGCGIRPKQKDDWLVIPNLWGGVVGRPSVIMKTPSMNQALCPLVELERDAKVQYEHDMEYHEVEQAAYKAQQDALKDSMRKHARKAKAGDPLNDFDDTKNSYRNLKKPDEPVWARYKTNDATIEKLSELLTDNPRGLLLFRDELVGLLSTWDKEGREPDRAFFLEAWNGYGNYTVDRIGRGTHYTENLCISLFGGIQPSKLIDYLQGAVNGNQNDGLIQRLQLLVYPDEPMNWQLVDEIPNHKAIDQYISIIKKLAAMDFRNYGATQDEGDKYPCFNFTPEAQNVFNEWLTTLQTVKLKQEENPLMVEHLGKYRSLLPSLALIFHLIDVAAGQARGQVSLKATGQAMAWCKYMESHARRIYGLIADIKIKAAEQLLNKIKADKLHDGFTIRDVYRNQWHLLTDRNLVQEACDELVYAGVLAEQPVEGGIGIGRPTTGYLINPKVKAG